MSIQSNAVKGFTLIEMMMVLSIAAILITIAVPSYNTFTKNSKLTKQVNMLAAAVSLARGEAAKRGSRVTVCQSNNPAPSDGSEPSCSGTAGTWSSGWLVFNDLDSDESYDPNPGNPDHEALIAVYQTETGVSIKTTAGTALLFNPDGSTTEGARTFAVCDDRGVSHGKKMDVSGTGRPSTGTATSCG